MGRKEERYNKRRLQTSYVTTVVSITLVLFMLGLLGMLLYHARKLSEHVKENIGLTAMIHDQVSETSILKLKKELDASAYVRESSYVSKDEAARVLMEELGEDFVGFLGYNPLLPSLEIRLVAAYANADSLALIEKKLTARKEIKEVFYQKSLVNSVNENLRKISMVILGFSGLLLIISIALINNTIRLAVFSKRFLIKTMQLVGATENFIRRPFLLMGITNGLYGALFSLGLLSGVIYLAHRQFPDMVNLHDYSLYLGLLGMVCLLGIFISLVSTFFAVRKYLKIKSEFLY
ncbi:MAG TPA: permease-like cell division protein FtsX [Bacteroidales bacterium]|nr:permease-like cell division protein FtsX [Bacteroidales bacterium]HSA44521.1 permease-like cell division protein FtsX [Bacteroidales bacterium]